MLGQSGYAMAGLGQQDFFATWWQRPMPMTYVYGHIYDGCVEYMEGEEQRALQRGTSFFWFLAG